MKYHNFEQQSPEWFAVRKLKLTASHAQAIGNNGKGLETYVSQIMTEHLSSAEPDRFTSRDTERGNELEPIAREMYELEKGVPVQQIGFIEVNKHLGMSPDGLIEEDGGVEFKCPMDTEYYNLLLKGEKAIDSKYIWQVQMNLLITKRKYWDLVFYNPNFKQSLLVFTLNPDEEKFKALEEGIEAGLKMLKEQLKKFK